MSAGGTIDAAVRRHYIACIYSGLRTIHEFGLSHRFINSNSIYLTTGGVPKVNLKQLSYAYVNHRTSHKLYVPCLFGFYLLTSQICDFRFAKQMRGALSFTICGDPLYFSPELVNHQGYDNAADLWAFGVLCYEMSEEATPFGHSDTAETEIFKKISSFAPSSLTYTDRTPESLQSLIGQLLAVTPSKRIGYISNDAVMKAPYFTGK
jgi:serine/threonine protein kinase